MLNAPMALNRLFIDTRIAADQELWLEGNPARYVARVLRLRADNALCVFDGAGGEYPATVLEVRRDRVLIRVADNTHREAESPLHIHLLQCVSRGDRMDIVVQKATELGARRITPLLSEFSVVRLDAARRQRKTVHWQRVAQSACEQCGRNRIPKIDDPTNIRDWFAGYRPTDGTRLVMQPGSARNLSSATLESDTVILLIGPEGGLAEGELALAGQFGFSAVSLGPRILRTETAAISVLASLQARFGDM